MNSGDIIIPYFPHPGQLVVHNCMARFKVLANGRRWGKTMFAVMEILKQALNVPGEYWWVAPTYKIAQRAWMLWDTAMGEVDGERVPIIPRELYHNIKGESLKEIFNGSRVYFLSADNPESLIGSGINGVVMDEAARCSSVAWYQSIRPALGDHKGWAILISTPRGKNWFYNEWMRGRDKERFPDYESFNAASHQNTYLPREELEAFQRDMPEDAYRQEILAEFLDDSGTVFRNISSCVYTDFDNNPRTGPWVIGVDLAKAHDYTVITVMHLATKRVVEISRFNHIEWGVQKKMIADIGRRYIGTMVIDATGLGDPIVDDLLRVPWLNITPFKITSASKAPLIDRLKLAIEQRQISFPPNQQLIDELSAYTYEYNNDTGRISYSSPEGFYDDCVISLALAVHGASEVPDSFVFSIE